MSGPTEPIDLRRPPFAGSNFAKEAVQAVRAHPAFPQAAREVAQGFVEHYQGNRLSTPSSTTAAACWSAISRST
jgi:hypothetical protein